MSHATRLRLALPLIALMAAACGPDDTQPEPKNRSPSIEALSPVTVEAGRTVTVTVRAADPDGDAVTLSLTDAPSFVSLQGATLTLAPDDADVGEGSLQVMASDGKGGEASASLSFEVTERVVTVERSPVVSGLRQESDGKTLAAGGLATQPVVVGATVVDPEGLQVKLEVEVRTTEEAFTARATHVGELLSSGGVHALALPALPVGSYKWRLRAVNANADASEWLDFNDGAEAFFVGGGKLEGTLTINDGAQATNARAVTLALDVEAPEGATLAQMRFVNDVGTFSDWEAFAATKSWTLDAAEGSRLVRAQVTDDRGGTGEFSASIVLDTTRPQTIVTAVDGPVTRVHLGQARVVGEDSGSGLASQCVLVTSAPQPPPSLPALTASCWKPAAGETFVDIPQTQGEHVVSAWHLDRAGNVSEGAGVSIRFDNTPPTISALTLNGGKAFAGPLSVTVEIDTDEPVGATLCVGLDAQPADCVPYAASSTYVFAEPQPEGSLTVYARVLDAAGNPSSLASAEILVDATAPEGSIALVGGGMSTRELEPVFVANADDGDGSGDVSVFVRLDDDTPPFEGDVWLSADGFEFAPFTLVEGRYVVHAWFKDAVGNVQYVTSNLRIDQTPPAVTGMNITPAETTQRLVSIWVRAADPDDGTIARVCLGEDPLNLTCVPATPDSQDYDYELVAGSDGVRRVYAVVEDDAGNVSDALVAASRTVNYDTTPPVVDSVELSGMGGYTGSPSATVLVLASDASGVREVAFSTDGGVTFGEYRQYLGSSSAWGVDLPAGDGLKEIHAKVRDGAGNESQPPYLKTSIVVDTAAPTVSGVVLNGGAAYTKSTLVEVSVNASDPGGELGIMSLSTDGGASFSAYTWGSSVFIDVPAGDGLKVVHARVSDKAGNESQAPHKFGQIILDQTGPTGTLTVANGQAAVNSKDVSVKVTSTDGAGSGVEKWCVKADVTTTPSSGDACWRTDAEFTLTNLSEGQRTVRAWFMDKVGNIGAPATATVRVDLTPPSLTNFAIYPGGYTASLNVRADVTASDTAGTLTELCLGTVNPPTSCVPWATQVPFTLSAGSDGNRTVYASAKDDAGNFSNVMQRTITVDRVAPVVTAFTLNGGKVATNARTVSVEATITEANVVAKHALSLDGSTWTEVEPGASFTLPDADGRYVVHFRARDGSINIDTGAWNWSAAKTFEIVLDRVAPTGTLAFTPETLRVVQGGVTYVGSSYGLTMSATDAPAGGQPGSGVTHYTLTTEPSLPAGQGWVSFEGYLSHNLTGTTTPERTVYAWFRDAAGNVSAPASLTYAIDATGPSAPSIASGSSVGHRMASLSWSASTDDGVGLAGYQIGWSITGAIGPYTFDPVQSHRSAYFDGLPNGMPHTFAVRAIDRLGNESISPVQTLTPRYPFDLAHKDPGADLYDLAYWLDGTLKGVAVGQGGAVYTTDDGWVTRTRRDPLVDVTLRGVARAAGGPAQGTLVAVGDGQTLLRSNNEGATWAPMPVNSANWSSLNAVTHVRHTASASYMVAVGSGGTVLRAVMSGTNDEFVEVDTSATGYTGTLQSVHGNGYVSTVVAVGTGGAVLRSSDSGATWTKLTTSPTTATLNAVNVIDATRWVIGAKSGLWYTADAGVTWKELSNGASHTVHGIASTSAALIYSAGQLDSYGSGQSRTRIARYDAIAAPTAAYLSPPAGALAPARSIRYATGSVTDLAWVGDSGDIGTSSNRGATTPTLTTRHLGSGNTINGISVTMSGILADGYAVGSEGLLLRFGSGRWNPVTFTGKTSTRMHAVSTALNGSKVAAVAVGASGMIWRTDGDNWSVATSPTSVSLNGVSCAASDRCYAAGAQATLLYFNGSTWVQQASDTSGEAYRAVGSAREGTTIRTVAVGDKGFIRRGTQASGASTPTWTNVTGPVTSANFLSVDMKSTGVALVGGASGMTGVLYRSTDFGVTWTVVTTTFGGITGISWQAGNIWYFVTDRGALMKSFDDGLTFEEVETSVGSAPLYAIDSAFTTSGPLTLRSLVAGGRGGLLLRSVNGQGF